MNISFYADKVQPDTIPVMQIFPHLHRPTLNAAELLPLPILKKRFTIFPDTERNTSEIIIYELEIQTDTV